MRRNDATVEPVNFQALPLDLYEELLHQVGDHVPAVIDLTPATDTLALCCLQKGIPYLGICFSTQHVELLHERLEQCAFQLQHNSTSPLYKAGLALIMRKMGLAAKVACPSTSAKVACPSESAKAAWPSGTPKPEGGEAKQEECEGGEELEDGEEEGDEDFEDRDEGAIKEDERPRGRRTRGRRAASRGRGRGRDHASQGADDAVTAAAAKLAAQMFAATGSGNSGSAADPKTCF